MKNIAVLGSTGSIGTQTLDVVRANPERLCVKALAAGHNITQPGEPDPRVSSADCSCLGRRKSKGAADPYRRPSGKDRFRHGGTS